MKVSAVETQPVVVQLDQPILRALSNAAFLEYMPWFSRLYNEALEFRDGSAVVPERPGWGFTFNRDYIAHLSR